MESLIGKLTEEEARTLLDDSVPVEDPLYMEEYFGEIIDLWKQKGYIKKDPVEDPVEDAEEMYSFFYNGDYADKEMFLCELVGLMKKAIDHQKQQLKDKEDE